MESQFWYRGILLRTIFVNIEIIKFWYPIKKIILKEDGTPIPSQGIPFFIFFILFF